MRTRTKVIIGVIVSLILLSLHVIYDTSWTDPGVGIENTNYDEGPGKWGPCWLVEWVLPLKLQRTYYGVEDESQILRTEPFYWEDIDIYEMPTRKQISHDQSGTVDVGDIACTSTHSQRWVYRPTGTEVTSYCFTPEWTTCRSAPGGTE